MEGRTIALFGGGELIIGAGPLIEGLIHAWVNRPRAGRCDGFMIQTNEAAKLAQLLERREDGEVKLFAGRLTVSHSAAGLAFLWFYRWGQQAPDFSARLHEGTVDAAAEAFAELCEDDLPRRAAA